MLPGGFLTDFQGGVLFSGNSPAPLPPWCLDWSPYRVRCRKLFDSLSLTCFRGTHLGHELTIEGCDRDTPKQQAE